MKKSTAKQRLSAIRANAARQNVGPRGAQKRSLAKCLQAALAARAAGNAGDAAQIIYEMLVRAR